MPENEKRPLLQIPHIGPRTVKTIASATLVAFVYGMLGFNPCFACIGAVYGMGSTFRGGLKSGGNRFAYIFRILHKKLSNHFNVVRFFYYFLF